LSRRQGRRRPPPTPRTVPVRLSRQRASSNASLCLLLEDADTRREPMEKIARTDRANFPVAEKARDRNGPRCLRDHPAVVVRLTVEVRTAAITGEQQRATGWPCGQVRGQRRHQGV